MKQKDVPIYRDPEDFEDDKVKYPCTTQYMRYNALMRQYELTNEGLDYYCVDVKSKLVNMTVEAFIRQISKKIYEFISYRVGNENFPVMQYRIATAPETLYNDSYSFRKRFEQVLVDQANYLLENGDSAKVSRYSVDIGEAPAPRPDEATRDTSDLSPEALRALESMNLLRWHSRICLRALEKEKF